MTGRRNGHPVRRLAGDEQAVARRVHTAVVARLADLPDGAMSLPDQRQLVVGWIQDELRSEGLRRLTSGEQQLDEHTEHAVVRSVENALWGLGRIQSLLELPDVEDVYIIGCDVPTLRMRDGSLRRADAPIADTDADLVQQLQYIAAHHGSSERAFSPAHPCLNMQLPDGSRLAAMREVVPRPSVTIRRHRLVDVTLADLVRAGTLSAELAQFLSLLVQARQSLLVTGMPSSGKTTLLRALYREIPATEAVATLETEFELNLHLLRNRPPVVFAAECRSGSTERDPSTGRPAGEMTLAGLLHQVLRMSVTRVIVGEVRGAEALPMLEAMNAGMPGSMCTLHAGSAAGAMERLVTAAMQGAGPGWSDRFLTRLAAQGIDYVVHMRHGNHGARGRFVAEVAEVTDVNEAGNIAMNTIFGPGGNGDPRAALRMAPQVRRPFDEAGLDLSFLHAAEPFERRCR